MKSEKGITLTSLVIYVIIATILISSLALLSSFFFSNMSLVKAQDQYAPEFNKFCMFFIGDVKNNKSATVTDTQVVFEDGTKYEYKESEKAIYRNDKKIAKRIQSIKFTSLEEGYKVGNTTKQTITVNISIGSKKTFDDSIEFTLKYW